MPEPAAQPKTAAPSAISPPASVTTAGHLFSAIWSLSLLGTIIGIGRHDADALASFSTDSLPLWDRLSAVPGEAWLAATGHLLAGIASLVMGYLVVSLAYPRRHLAREAHINPAAALQASAHLLGAAVIATVSWGGADGTSLVVSGVFCVLGWISLAAVCAIHRAITRYADHEEIAHGNVASALASAGLHLAVALVVGHAIQGQFNGWASSLAGFGRALVWVVALYPLRQIVLARFILRMSPAEMDAAVSTQHDTWLGAAEGIFYVLSAICLSAGW
jgi:uncharacterized membrane protein YjfL (UPF0719 family)